jgi:valyl-tRNA synthetase
MMLKIGELSKYTGSIESKLRNKNFTDRAPREVVDNEKNKLAEANISLDKLKENLKRLET